MTLPIELDLDMFQVDLHVKFLVRMSNGSAVRVHTDSQTHTQKHGCDSITSTADAGGKKAFFRILKRWSDGQNV